MAAQKPRPGSAFAAFLGFIAFSVLAGILVTVMVTPALAVSGVAATQTIDAFDNLPEYLPVGATPQQNTIWAISGRKEDGSPKYKQIATVYSQNRQEIAWEDVSQTLKDAVLAAEDRRFYEHGGIDIQGIARAAVKNLSGGKLQGASTLTQQLVKNICITQAVTDNDDPSEEDAQHAAIELCQETTFDRKIKEMKQAIGLEKQLTKDEILLGYLNIAGFGGNVYGIQSAAERYFGVDATDLTIAQAASLVGIVQEPGQRRLDLPENFESNIARRNVIINNMYDYGMIPVAERDEAVATPVDKTTVEIAPPENGCIAANRYAKQFCDYIVRSVKDLEPLGASVEEREANWKIGGYALRTTLDLKLNKVAQDALRAYAPIKETRLQLGAAATSIEPGTGHIVTMAQNKVFDNQGEENGGGRPGTSAINFNTDKAYGGSSGFQPGSGYKIFTLLNWLEAGHGLNEVVNVGRQTTPFSRFTNSCIDLDPSQSYSPRNDQNEGGRRSVREATANSINGGYVQMALQLDLCETKNIALALGVHRAATVPATESTPEIGLLDLDSRPASILGVDEIAPMTLAAAYATVANKGIYCKPIAVTSIVDSTGTDIGGQAEDCSSQVPVDVAAAAADALSTGAGRYQGNPQDGTPLIGKTGTTNESKQTWITMSSTALTTTVWFGNIRGEYPIRGYSSGGTFGGNQRHLIMRAILSAANQTYKGGTFDAAPERLIKGINVQVGSYIGMDEATAKSTIQRLELGYSNEGTIASSVPAGQVAKQDPADGLTVSQGQEVKVWLSDGTKSVVPDVTTTPMDAGSAQAAVTAAGFPSVALTCVPTPVRDGSIDPLTGQPANPQLPADNQVLSISPATGTTLMKSKVVTLNVAHAGC